MIYKFYTEGNQTIIEDESGRQLVGLSKDVFVRPANNALEDPTFYFDGIFGWDIYKTIKLSEITDKTGNSLTLEVFKTFYQNELGKGSAGSTALSTLRIKDQVLSTDGWVLNFDSNLLEYTYLNAAITTSTEPEMIPHNDSVDVVNAAGILPYTTVIDGGMIVYAENIPSANITVNILIKSVQDV